jgi:hypothetical protein
VTGIPRWAELVAAVVLVALFVLVLTRGDLARWVP